VRSASRRGGRSPRPPAWLLVLLVVSLAATVLAIAALSRERTERRLATEAAAERARALAADAEPADEEPPDPLLQRLLAAADAENASVAALDAAAHALLVREDFEEAEPFVIRALAASPHDVEATIHRAVLRGVLDDVPGARADLQRLANGAAGWEASLFEAGFALRDGDEAAALRAFRRFQAAAPREEVTPALVAEMARLEARLESSAGKK
jgi:tetratricopeptide (TPR) repeat protein